MEYIRNDYGMKSPYSLLRRMKRKEFLHYDAEKDVFALSSDLPTDQVFMSMEELCGDTKAVESTENTTSQADLHSLAMDRLMKELIGDRLLELSKYITMGTLSKRIIIDKPLLIQDGYQVLPC